MVGFVCNGAAEVVVGEGDVMGLEDIGLVYVMGLEDVGLVFEVVVVVMGTWVGVVTDAQ